MRRSSESAIINGILISAGQSLRRDYGTVPKNKNYVDVVITYSMDDFR
jgi:hypothetical protein